MYQTTPLQSQSIPIRVGRGRSVEEGQEGGKKPKKVNSEIRKQQNRIASRNYREKRKKKLQYLQQLIKDGDSPEQQAPQPAVQTQRHRMISPAYHAQSPPASTYVLHSNASYSTLSSTSGNAINSILPTSTAAYSNHTHPTSQPYPSFEPSWNTSMYDSTPPINISAWNVPAWMPSLDYTPPVASRQDSFQYTPPHSHQGYEEVATPSPQPQPQTPDSDMFVASSYKPYRRHENQSLGISNVSLPSSASSSPFCHTRYPVAP